MDDTKGKSRLNKTEIIDEANLPLGDKDRPRRVVKVIRMRSRSRQRSANMTADDAGANRTRNNNLS